MPKAANRDGRSMGIEFVGVDERDGENRVDADPHLIGQGRLRRVIVGAKNFVANGGDSKKRMVAGSPFNSFKPFQGNLRVDRATI